jgi:hypothetical protein
MGICYWAVVVRKGLLNMLLNKSARNFRGTCTKFSIKAVLSSNKTPPNEGNCALAHRTDTGIAHVTLCIATIVRARLMGHLV